KNDDKCTAQFGLIAEEVVKVNPDLVLLDKDGNPFTVRYEQVNAMLLNEFLKEHAIIQELKKEVAALKAGLQEVSNQLKRSRPIQLAENGQQNNPCLQPELSQQLLGNHCFNSGFARKLKRGRRLVRRRRLDRNNSKLRDALLSVYRYALTSFVTKQCLADGGLVGDDVAIRIAVPRAEDRVSLFHV